MDAFLLHRSLKTLAVRMDRHSENAQAVAEFLVSHPKARNYHQPGACSTTGWFYSNWAIFVCLFVCIYTSVHPTVHTQTVLRIYNDMFLATSQQISVCLSACRSAECTIPASPPTLDTR